MHSSRERSTDADLIPPAEMLIDGSSSPEQFVALGESFCRELLVKRARLEPTSSILDLGCGNGSVARALTRILSPQGSYDGLDIHGESIAWLRAHYEGYPNFRFTHADVYNKMYNPQGGSRPADYRFPYPDESFDIILLKSVFTHMLPDDLRAYLRECGRVLRRSGRAVITYFLLNEDSARFSSGSAKLRLDILWDGDPGCRVANAEVPEHAVGHDEARIRGYYREVGLSIAELAFGDWCGRPTMLGFQDLVIALKE